MLVKLPIHINSKHKNCCEKDCPFFYTKEDVPYCFLFGKLKQGGSVILREESCLEAEDAFYHFDSLVTKI